MSHCFATGCSHDKDGKPLLSFIHSIEYLTYDLDSKTIKVCGDFIAKNVGDQPAHIYGLHRGNINFQDTTPTWLTDKTYTRPLLQIAGKSIGLDVALARGISLWQYRDKPHHVDLLIGESQRPRPWGPPRPADGSYTYFTAWQSPAIAPGQCALHRVLGDISDESYARMMPAEEEIFNIKGGEPLRDSLREELSRAVAQDHDLYLSAFDLFNRDLFCQPQTYHLFLESNGAHRVRVTRFSTDIEEGARDYPLDGRLISWYCSDSDFNLYAMANGPVLTLATA